MARPRRNPKRKAASMTADQQQQRQQQQQRSAISIPDNLLEVALGPIDDKEIEEWEGWIELESDPAFFNTIIQRWGVDDVKIHEVFGMDQPTLDLLPKPVYGLIFLFQYLSDGPEMEVENAESSAVWFANQTTDNACATVALLNIIMNCQDVKLGPKLDEFKQRTIPLSTPLRGHMLSSDPFIRTAHNFLTRRIDHLNADLWLENESARAIASADKPIKRRNPRRPSRKKEKTNSDVGYHFIAYVPSGGQVWELDGLKANPVCLGSAAAADSWTSIARPRIEARVMQYEEDQYSFSLLSLCGSPLQSLSRTIATSLRSLRDLDSHMGQAPEWPDLVATAGVKNPVDTADAASLAQFGLTPTAIDGAEPDPDTKALISNPGPAMAQDASDLHRKLLSELRSAVDEYLGDVARVAEDGGRGESRRMDYTPACHGWVQVLAEEGVLEELIRETKGKLNTET